MRLSLKTIWIHKFNTYFSELTGIVALLRRQTFWKEIISNNSCQGGEIAGHQRNSHGMNLIIFKVKCALQDLNFKKPKISGFLWSVFPKCAIRKLRSICHVQEFKSRS